MPTSTTEIANAVLSRKDGHMPRFTMARPKPAFVVSSISTKRYAPSMSKKTPVQKLSPIPPLPISTKERIPFPRGTATKPSSQPGSLPTMVTKTEPRRPSTKSMPMPAPNMTTKVQKSLPLPLVPSAERPLPQKTFVPKPLRIVQRLKEGKLVGGCPVSLTRKSTRVTTANEVPPRPSCVPRSRIYRSSVGVSETSKGKQDPTVKVSTTGPRNIGIAHQKPSITINVSKTAGRVRTTDVYVKKPVVAGDCRTGTPTRNRRLTPPNPIVYPQAAKSSPRIASPPPASPDLSSFPSQSWTIVVDVDIKQVKTPTTIYGDETFSNMCDTPKSGVAETPNHSYGASESITSSPTLSSSPIALQTFAGPAEPTIGSDGMVKMSSPTKGSSAKVSHTICAATIISPTRNGTASSMTTLAKVLERNQALSPAGISEASNGTRTTVQCAIEIARTFLSPSRRASQLGIETASHRTMGTDVSRTRKLFIPPFDKDAKVSKNPSTQMEIEMLRARKKVANGGMVDPYLDRLGSLAAMAIVTKRLGTSGADNTSRV